MVYAVFFVTGISLSLSYDFYFISLPHFPHSAHSLFRFFSFSSSTELFNSIFLWWNMNWREYKGEPTSQCLSGFRYRQHIFPHLCTDKDYPQFADREIETLWGKDTDPVKPWSTRALMEWGLSDKPSVRGGTQVRGMTNLKLFASSLVVRPSHNHASLSFRQIYVSFFYQVS